MRLLLSVIKIDGEDDATSSLPKNETIGTVWQIGNCRKRQEVITDGNPKNILPFLPGELYC